MLNRSPTASSATGDLPSRPGLAYMPGIDGLRALAVAGVVIYHLGAGWLPGGYLGVDVFLVISGFLITSLLLVEHDRSGRINLRRFWFRRARRLLPAVFVMIAVVLAVMLVLHTGEVAHLRGQIIASLAYVVNWHFIFADVPYFEQFGRPSVFLHLWSLAIEEQFYLVWPLVLAAVMMLAAWRRTMLALIVVSASATSVVLAWVLWEPFVDPSRIYYGTDTRAVALLAGVLLALAPAALRGHPPARRIGRISVQALGVLGLVGVLIAMFTLGDLDERLYRGGFLLVAVAATAVIAATADSSSPIGRMFAVAPMLWLGLRSYSIYLWHWPVIALTRPNEDVPFDGPALLALRVALMLILAASSYRFIEVPFRRHGWQGVREALRSGSIVTRRFRVAAASGVGIAVAALIVALALVPPGTTSIPGLTADAAARSSDSIPTTAGADRTPLLFVGDSVMLGASDGLRAAFGERAVVDAAAGREFPDGAAIVRGHLRRMPAETVPVIHLGNNSFIDPALLDGLMTELSARPRVLLLTVRVPLPWQDSVNDAVRQMPTKHPNVHVVDWYAGSSEPGLLVDGAHMNERGISAYTDILTAALNGMAETADTRQR